MRNKIEAFLIYVLTISTIGLAYGLYYVGSQLTHLSKEITTTSLACNTSQEDACNYGLTLSKAIDLNEFDFINIVLSVLVIFIALGGIFSFFYIRHLAKAASEEATKMHLNENCKKMIEDWLKKEEGQSTLNELIQQRLRFNENIQQNAQEIANTISDEDANAIAENLDDPEQPE